MYISRVELTDIRGFSGSRNVELTLTRPDGSHAGWTVIAGRNASGKSTLLRAVALTLADISMAHGLMPDFQDWITVGKNLASAELLLNADAEADYWQTAGDRQAARFSISLSWDAPVQDPHGRGGKQPGLSSAGDYPYSAGIWATNPIGWFCAGYGPFRHLTGGTVGIQRIRVSSGPVARLAGLFYEDASFTEGVQWLIDQHLRELEGRPGAEELKNAAIAILGDGLLPDDCQVSDFDSDGLWVSTGEHRFSLREMSDGYRTVAALVVVVFGSGDDAVLSELFGLDSPYSEQAEKLRRELVALEVKVISGHASEAAVARYQTLRRLLTSSPVARADEVSARLREPGE